MTDRHLFGDAHIYVWEPHASGILVYRIPAEQGSHGEIWVLIDHDGYVHLVPSDFVGPGSRSAERTLERVEGPHPYTVVEYDRTKRVNFGSGIHTALLYLDIYGPNDFHARVLYDTVGIPIFAQQNGNYDD